ncbi:hypothetical protein K402DRAFT_403448 [Aulographum hederae CBS 113979]|uniref:FAD/NAD(P)-binding domain-containing protein n=1 Tax=Aulographum hederae CBS 113979 TaxID=1176131 RepID=A0A6G1H450_9PEZI|nr:hypothetical protein K402DRAFT_403448 [Aulographum hederae CBS 113979]
MTMLDFVYRQGLSAQRVLDIRDAGGSCDNKTLSSKILRNLTSKYNHSYLLETDFEYQHAIGASDYGEWSSFYVFPGSVGHAQNYNRERRKVQGWKLVCPSECTVISPSSFDHVDTDAIPLVSTLHESGRRWSISRFRKIVICGSGLVALSRAIALADSPVLGNDFNKHSSEGDRPQGGTVPNLSAGQNAIHAAFGKRHMMTRRLRNENLGDKNQLCEDSSKMFSPTVTFLETSRTARGRAHPSIPDP